MSDLVLDQLSVMRGTRKVIHDLSARFEPAALIGLIGPNGAGKTTLLRAVMGLLPYRGSVKIRGEECLELSASARARRVAYVPQDKSVEWPVTVADIVALGRHPFQSTFGRLDKIDQEAVDEAISATGIDGLRARSITTLSGGERARVLLARALAMRTPILLVDEPVAALDPAHQIGTMNLLSRLAKEGRTIICVLHDLPLAARFCDQLVLLSEGGLAGAGTPEDCLTKDRLGHVFGIEAITGRHAGTPFLLPWRVMPRASEDG